MSDYDQDILRQAERDGVRTMSGHHMGFRPKRYTCKMCGFSTLDQREFVIHSCETPIPDDELFATRTEWREQPL